MGKGKWIKPNYTLFYMERGSSHENSPRTHCGPARCNEGSRVDGFLIPSSDPHMSEYLPDSYQARSWFSGFNGSVGTLAVTADAAALWVDGRYFIQAERQIAGSGIELMRIAQKGTPEIPAWLADTLPENGVMGVDGMVTATSTVEKLNKAFEKKHISIRDIDFVTPLWEGRPAAPATPRGCSM